MIEIDKEYILSEESNLKCKIRYVSWNNYGFWTLFDVFISKTNVNTIKGWFHILKPFQEIGERQWKKINDPYSFTGDIDFAEKLFLLFTPEERKLIIKFLNLQVEESQIWNSKAFKESVLRDKSLESFKETQVEIRNLIFSPNNICRMIVKNQQIVQMFTEKLIKESTK